MSEQDKTAKKLTNFIPAIALVAILLAVVVFNNKIGFFGRGEGAIHIMAEPVSAKEIYPFFLCPCCGRTIDVGCCGMAQERMAFVDGLTEGDLTKDQVIEKYVKKYGLSSFIDDSQKQEFRQKLIANAPEDRPIINIVPFVYDFGEVSQADGVVETVFEIENQGKTDLIINNIETSCGCTTAAIIYKGEQGPAFSMPGHGAGEEVGDWSVAIEPGDTAQLKVYYDPGMHGDLRGDVIREIHIFSSDPIDFEKEVSIELNQVE